MSRCIYPLYRILFKTFNGEVFNEFVGTGNAIQEFNNLALQNLYEYWH